MTIASGIGGDGEFMGIEIRAAGADSWNDVTSVMGAGGGYSGCWCMFWRLTNADIHRQTAADNRAALEALVAGDPPIGLLLYQDGEPAGWCQVAPRLEFARLFRTRGLEFDLPTDASVWSIVCVYVKREARGHGVADLLVRAAVEHAKRYGATTVEGYPVTDAGKGRKTQLSSGTIDLFRRAGFRTDTAETGRRIIMRREV